MNSGRIGFVSICHPDYMNEIVENQTFLAEKNIADCGFEVVKPDFFVTDYATAEKAGRFLACNDVDGVVIFLAAWIECPDFMSVLCEIEHKPIFVQSFPMCMFNGKQESTGAYVSFAMIKGTLDRIGVRYSSYLGETDCEEAKKKIEDFCVSACACSSLRRSRIGLVGYTSMSIYTGTFDHVFMRKLIGPEIVQSDTYSLINRAESKTDEEKRRVVELYRGNAKIHNEVQEEFLMKSAGLYLAMEDMVKESGLKAINVKCQYELSKEYKMVPCVPLSLLAQTGTVTSCEGDILNTVSMLILNLLCGDVVTYGDAMNHHDNVVKLSSCGFMPFCMSNSGEALIRNFMPHPGFTGIQSSSVLRPEKVTVMRLVEDKCNFHIVYFTGKGLPTELRQGYMPAIDIELDGDVNKLVENYSGQHYAICYGDVSGKIEELAKMLGIEARRV